MAGMGVALCDQADEIAHIPLLDLMDALGAPIRNDVPPQETCDCQFGLLIGDKSEQGCVPSDALGMLKRRERIV